MIRAFYRLSVLLWLLLLVLAAVPARAGGLAPQQLWPSAAPGPRVQAQGAPTADLPLNLLDPQTDIVLRGNTVQQTLTFPLYANWKLEAGSELRLVLRYSPLLLAERSTLSVSMGDTPLGAVRLAPEGAGGTNATIVLPAVAPPGAILSLTFAASLRTNDLTCADAADPAAYLILGHESVLHAVYTAQQQDLRLQDGPSLLLAGRYLPGSRIVFVLPRQPQLADWQAASMVAGRLGQLAGAVPPKIEVLPATETPSAALGDASIVFVGSRLLRERMTGVDLPIKPAVEGAGGAYLLHDELMADDKGLLAVGRLPWSNNGLALVVTGGKEDAELSAARALLDSSQLALLQGDAAQVQASSQLPSKPADTPLGEAPSTTLEQLGLQDRSVYGVGTRSISETVFVPAFWSIVEDAKLSVSYGSSDLLLPERSELTVLFNGLPVDSFKLADGGKQTQQTVTLPKTSWKPGDNTIEYRFELHVANEQQNCSPDDARNVWATVFNSTSLELHYGIDRTRRIDLGLYPYPFSGTGPEQDSARIILPTDPTAEEQGAALGIVTALSRFTGGGTAVPLLIPADLAEASKYNFDLILLGGPERNPISKQLNDKLPVQWNGNTAQTLRTQWGVVFPAEGQGDLGLVQEVASPWSANRLVLDAGYTRPGLVGRVAGAIGSGLYIGRYSGNVLVVDLDGKVTALSTVAQETPTPAPVTTPVTGTTTPTKPGDGRDATLIIVALLLAVVLLGAVLLVLRVAPRPSRQRRV